MLLPEAFQRGRTPEVVLAFDAPDRILLGAAAYHFQNRTMFLRRLRVIRAHRRRGVGSALIRQLAAMACDRSMTAIRAHANTLGSPELEPFFMANGFATRGRMWVVQIAVESALSNLAPLRRRLVTAGRVPASAYIARPADAPVEEAARLCAAHMESDLSVHSAFFRASVYAKKTENSSILMVAGRVAGLLIAEGSPGVEFARVTAHVIAPEYRRGWANVFLLTAAVERAAALGVRTVRFEALEDNLDTVNLIRRFGGEIVQVMSCFERRVTQAAP
jgi:GNAT superfamily N-acetyltransferase